MNHLVLWLNLGAFTVFFAAFALSFVVWGRSPRGWTRTSLWFLGIMAGYQFLFSFLYFSSLYTEELSSQVGSVLSIVQAGLSALSVYFLPLLYLQLLNRKPGRVIRVFAALPPVLLVLSALLFLQNRDPYLVSLVNTAFYLYILVISAAVLIQRKRILEFPDTQVMIYFFMINAGFYLFLIVDLFLLHTRLAVRPAETIPGVLVAVPLFMLAWGILFIWWHVKKTWQPEKLVTDIPPDFIQTFGLTEREREVMGYLLSGASSRRIGGTLFISTRTVDTHVYNIYRKCGVKSRFELLQLLKTF